MSRYVGSSPAVAVLIAGLFLLMNGCAYQTRPDKRALAFDHRENGDQLLLKGQNKEALKEYQMSEQLEPGFWPTHYKLAVTYGKLNNFDAAIAEYRQVIGMKPPFNNKADAALLHLALGQALDKRGERNEARFEWRQAIALASQDTTHKNNISQVAKQAHQLLNKDMENRPVR